MNIILQGLPDNAQLDLKEICRYTGINHSTLEARYSKGKLPPATRLNRLDYNQIKLFWSVKCVKANIGLFSK